MKKRSVFIGTVLPILALLSSSVAAWEYFISPPNFSPEVPIKWYEFDSDVTTPRTIIFIDDAGLLDVNDGDFGVNAVVGGIHAWNSSTLDRLVTAIPTTSPTYNLLDGQPTLHFNDPSGACIGSCLALAIVTYYDMGDVNADPNDQIEVRSCNGRDYLPYYDVAIVTNNTAWSATSAAEVAAGDSCSSEFFVEAVMGHEAGHMLGLGHEDDVMSEADALMFPSLGYCDNKTLQSDDLAGRDVIYDCPDSCEPPPPPPPPSSLAAAFSWNCSGLNCSFDGTSSSGGSGPLSYNWDFDGDGSPDATGQTTSHPFPGADTYTATLEVTDSASTDSAAGPVKVRNKGKSKGSVN